MLVYMNNQACRSVGAPRGRVVAFNSSQPVLRATYSVGGTAVDSKKRAGYYGENAPDAFYNTEMEGRRQMRDRHDGVAMASRNEYLGATKNDDRYRADQRGHPAASTVINEMNNISPLRAEGRRSVKRPLMSVNVAQRMGILLKMFSNVRGWMPQEESVASPSSGVSGSPRYKSALEKVSHMTSESRRGAAK
mmetsp:Transcript_10240/g.20212  ORF Transcript_10240/g.20212 Transcript_10240/m.20212 type:complete len:192 (+) Transcript_10240:173-748(+)